MMPEASPWVGRRALVTGAAGFLGGWLCQRLISEGAQVVALVRTPPSASSAFVRVGLRGCVHLVEGSVEDGERVTGLLRDHPVDLVFHLAAETPPVARATPGRAFETNVRGTWTVLDAVRAAGRPVGVIITSSDEVYGESPDVPWTEDVPLRAVTPYQVSKMAAEMVARSYHHAYGLRVGIARCATIYGGGDLNFDRLVPGTIRSVLRGERPVIRSNGRVSRDCLYVEDAVAAVLALGLAVVDGGIAGETFNVSSGTSVTVLEVVETVLQLMGRPDLTPAVLGRAGDEVVVKCSSPLKASKLLGWSPQTTLEDGLARAIAWYRALGCEPRTLARDD